MLGCFSVSWTLRRDPAWLGGRWEQFCNGHGTSDALLARLEFFVGCLGWTTANKERKHAGGGWGRSSHRKPRIKTLAGLCGHCDHTAGPRG